MGKPKLCYVEGCFAYFTTQALSKQTGDDWNDSPFDCNAEPPYEWNEQRDSPKWEIVKVAFDADLRPPDSYNWPTYLSVDQVNAKVAPWLQPSYWQESWGEPVQIWAGTSLDDFKSLVKRAGGDVYVLEKP